MKRHAIKIGQGKGNTPSASARCRHMLRYICRVLCTVNSTHGSCTDSSSPSCIRRVQVRSIQWTPLVVQSKRASTRIRFEPPPKCRTMQDGDFGMPRVAHVAAMLVGCSPLSENLARTTLSLPRSLHWLNTLYCTRQRLTFLSSIGSHISRLQAAEIDRGRHLLRMDKNSTLTMLTFSCSRGSYTQCRTHCSHGGTSLLFHLHF